jgi:predicted CXXCH cytochrome family protein
MKSTIYRSLFIISTIVTVIITGATIEARAEDDPGHRVNETNSNDTGTLGQAGTKVKNIIESNGFAQKTHGDYKSNTNSCASCHLTHTANGDSLLIEQTVGATCMACHDGSLGFYDVKSGKIFTNSDVFTIEHRQMKFDHDNDITTPMEENHYLDEEMNLAEGDTFQVGSTAGLFPNETDHSQSMHNVYDDLELSAAPGGNIDGGGNWDKKFGCQSCHAPHGSYSDRLLHYNPNGMATTTWMDRGTSVGEAGLTETGNSVLNQETIDKQAPVYSSVPIPSLENPIDMYVLVRSSANNHLEKIVETGVKDINNQNIDINYFRTSEDGVTSTAITSNIIMVYKWDELTSKYIPDITPWISGNLQYNINASYSVSFFASTDPSLVNNTNISNGKDGNIVIDFGKAFAFSPDANTTWIDSVQIGHVARAYVVRLDKIKVATHNISGVELYVTNNGALVGEGLEDDGSARTKWGLSSSKGMGTAMSYFCISCHVDYLSDGESTGGEYVEGYRHKTDFDYTSCVRCHYSHGTNQEVMRDGNERNYAQLLKLGLEADLIDENQRAVIKRYVNMSACISCHSASDGSDGMFINKGSYEDTESLPEQGTWTSGNRWGIQW